MKYSMKNVFRSISMLLLFILLVGCNSQRSSIVTPIVVYKSQDLVITELSKNTFLHTSFLKTNDFGNVPCNGMIVKNNDEVVIFDTTTDNKSSQELISWIRFTLGCTVKAVITTHFHEDNLGGLSAFKHHNIPSYANSKTIELARKHGYSVPTNAFDNALTLNVGDKVVVAKYFGPGHTDDNVVGYFPSEDILFGGCLIKELDADKGYLGDANVVEWSKTVERVKHEFPSVNLVIPGHGAPGTSELLDYTIELFKNTK